MTKFQSIRGMNDLLPEQSHVWQWVEDVARRILNSYGYLEMRTPILEHTELFSRSIGETTDVVEKEMYSFEDRNGDQVSLRPEATAGLVRAGLEHGLFHNRQQRVWLIGPMFRRERPQRGRLRQFHQIDVEAFGMPGPDVDAEMIFLSGRLLQELGVGDLRLELNSLGTPDSRRKYRDLLVEHFAEKEEQLDEDCRRRLKTNPLRILDSKNPAMAPLIAAAPSMKEALDGESREHLQVLCSMLEARGVKFQLNPHLVRGLDYYTRTVFEWITDELGAQGTVCAGGRYDGLVETLGGKATPAIGFAMGMERLVDLIGNREVAGSAPVPHVYLILQGKGVEPGLVLAERLRDRFPHLRLMTSCGGGSFRSQFRRADRSGAGWALILGDEEVAGGTIGLKPLLTVGEQETLTLEALPDRLEALLGG